jgi:DNA-binding response OmpR family regulator/DNA-binding CsgD family transcriptional regulator
MKTVMVVDDTPANLEILLGYLTSANYRVLVAENGQRCLDQLERELPDIILLDLMMPGIDGIETCKRIRQRPESANIPIIVVTAADELDQKLEAFEAGAVDFLTKPIQPEEVKARVETHLKIRELQSRLKKQNEELSVAIELRMDAEKQLEESLDQALIVTNKEYRILFATRKARNLLSTFFDNIVLDQLPTPIQTWIQSSNSQTPLRLPHPRKGEIEIDNFSPSGPGNIVLLRIEQLGGNAGPKALLELGLTAREAEVLYWIAEGKTNPEIAIILDAALNTVKKHTNNLFAKLGVETRTGAARMALRILEP